MGRQHFWRYYDAVTERVIENRYLIANLIACSPDTPRVIGDLDVFAVQGKVIGHILASAQSQAAAEAAPTIVDPVQQTLVTLLQGHLNNPLIKRSEVRKIIAELRRPVNTTQVKKLKDAYTTFAANQQIAELIASLKQVLDVTHQPEEQSVASTPTFTRNDLRLICFDHVI